ncbi:MAG: hypothetical protein JKY98_05025, partial [Gammaproteobacteria bacterium]|nr:hypothetical protein [Gammaproteobacteria bacterium]
MNETRRQAYLYAMGIDSYFPRYPLPGARPSKIPIIEPIVAAPEPKRREEIQESAGLSGRTPPINAADANTEAEPAGKPVNESNPGTDEIQQGDLRFSLQFFRINDQLAVINEIPYLDDGSSGSSVQSLLLAILKALEIEPAHLNDPQLFSWPLAVEDDASAHRQADALLALE